METSSKTPARISKTLIASMLVLSLVLAGCSGQSEGGGSGNSDSGASGGQTTAPQTTQQAPQQIGAPATTEETTAQDAAAAQESSGSSTAFGAGLEAARNEAESWNQDAELYAVASLQPNVDAQGESDSWLYSFVSESAGAVISIPYSGGSLRSGQGQELPGGQIRRIAGDTLSTGELVDTPQAIQRSEKVRRYLRENPRSGASAGLDSASADEPEWILSVPAEGIQERVSAVE